MSGTWRTTWKYGGPLTLVWAGVCADLGALSEGWIDLRWSIAYAALLLISVLLLFVYRELATVHHLVNSQHDDAVDRIEQLTQALHAEGDPVPDAPPTRRAATS